MNNTTPANKRPIRALGFVLILGLGLMSVPVHATERNSEPLNTTTSDQSEVLSATQGAEPQLRSHMAASMRIGLTAEQLRQLIKILAERGDTIAAQRADAALKQALAAAPAR